MLCVGLVAATVGCAFRSTDFRSSVVQALPPGDRPSATATFEGRIWKDEERVDPEIDDAKAREIEERLLGMVHDLGLFSALCEPSEANADFHLGFSSDTVIIDYPTEVFGAFLVLLPIPVSKVAVDAVIVVENSRREKIGEYEASGSLSLNGWLFLAPLWHWFGGANQAKALERELIEELLGQAQRSGAFAMTAADAGRPAKRCG